MGTYSEFVNSDGYKSKESGAAFSLQLIDVQNPSVPILDAMGGINVSEQMNDSAVEEAGQEAVEDYVKERYSCSGNASFFYTAARNDALPTVEDFLGRDYILVQRIAPKRAGAGNIVNYFEGVAIGSTQFSHGARGLVNGSLAFTALRRLNGKQYAAKYGV